MDISSVKKILGGLPGKKVAVFGDYALDKYIHYDGSILELGRETGLPAHQVTHIRTFPGAAGTVCANLTALGFGRVSCFGITGDDGEGYELRRGLAALGCDTEHLLTADRLTNTFLKPLDENMREDSRYDYRTRTPVPKRMITELIRRLAEHVNGFDAVMTVDQFDIQREGLFPKYGVRLLSDLAANRPNTVFFADSRMRIGGFEHFIVKCNHLEAGQIAGVPPDNERLPDIGRMLSQLTGRPAFITCGGDGIMSFDGDCAYISPTIKPNGPIDIVGAGDAASAGIVAALCTGAAYETAAMFANITASVTIKKIGVTGTANPDEITAAAAHFAKAEPRRITP